MSAKPSNGNKIRYLVVSNLRNNPKSTYRPDDEAKLGDLSAAIATATVALNVYRGQMRKDLEKEREIIKKCHQLPLGIIRSARRHHERQCAQDQFRVPSSMLGRAECGISHFAFGREPNVVFWDRDACEMRTHARVNMPKIIQLEARTHTHTHTHRPSLAHVGMCACGIITHVFYICVRYFIYIESGNDINCKMEYRNESLTCPGHNANR